MSFAPQNIVIIKEAFNISYDKFADRLNKIDPDLEISGDTIYNYAKGRSPATGEFKSALAELIGVTVEIINERLLEKSEIKKPQKQKTFIEDAGQLMITNQFDILAHLRVILNLLGSSIKKVEHIETSDSVRSFLENLVKEEYDKVLTEKKQ